MTQAQSNSTVQVHYTGTLADGTVFDSSQGRDPLQFTIGEQQVIPGFEQAVTGMNEGETKTVTIPADKAYGPYRDELLLDVPRSQFPPAVDPQVGQQLQVQSQDGQPFMVSVAEVGDENVKLDANHPLAGQDLTFELELVTVR